MTMNPTDEQQAAADAGVTGDHLVVEAGAGSGKTTTLNYMAEQMLTAGRVRRGLYVGFNKVTATEAKEKFPRAFDCRTGHSLAYASHGRPLRHKLPSERPAQNVWEVARILKLSPLVVDGNGGPSRVVSAERLGWAARETVDRFARSADPDLTARHVGRDALPDGIDRRQYEAAVLDAARRAWADMASTQGRLRMPHDIYRKLWALSRPQLRVDVVMLDEAQDTAPVMADVVLSQQCQQVAVGDSNQQLYAWAGAVDALAKWGDAKRLYLTQSWRFGHAVAEEANKWLSLLPTGLEIVGNPGLDSELVKLGSEARAVLCRTNVGAVTEVMSGLAARKRVALVGGGREIESVARAAIALMSGRRTNHPEFCIFENWDEVRRAASGDEGDQTLKTFVHMMDSLGPEAVIEAMRELDDEKRADLIVSTGHKAKGREWGSVRIAEDFAPKKTPEEGDPASMLVQPVDAMLAYVAVTRAKLQLDRGPLSYVDDVLGIDAEETDSQNDQED